jgi:SAM-dependent methyltransferase
MPGFIGVDISPLSGANVLCDLQKQPWPFKDSAIDECYLSHTLEHLPNTIQAMEEIWRICKPGAILRIIEPYYNSPGASQDPTHVRFFTERTFDYFTEDHATELSHLNYYTRARFNIVTMDFQQRPLLRYLPKRLQLFLAHHLATVDALDVGVKPLFS